MSAKWLFTLLPCVCLFFIGCTQTPPVNTRAEANALRDIETQWVPAIKARDIDKIVSLYASEAVVMVENEEICVGHQAIRKSCESWLADTLVSKTLSETVDTVEVSASGDLAYTRGTNRFSQNTSKGIVDYVGKWLCIYKKIDGTWKVIVDISNSDKPLRGQ
jgi:ketosteroid isomerase-like protein